MSPDLLTEYRRIAAQARGAFADLVESLNRRDTCDMELGRARHPLPPERVEYLTDKATLAHHRCEHLERELMDYDMTLRRLARELGLDDDERGDGARSSGQQRTGPGHREPATRAPRGSAATHQLGLFA